MTYIHTGFPYAEFEKLRKSSRKSNISRIRAQGRLRQRVQRLEGQLDQVSRTLAALLAVVEEKGAVTREELVGALDRLESSSEATE